MKKAMDIRILRLIGGARQAEGLTVIIDVFRAFSLECRLYAFGAAEVRPVGALEEAMAWRKKDPGAVLIGERHGARCEGFDFGNSPSEVTPEAIRGRRVIHTTSAGTQGVVNARHASEILAGSFVNARATADYIAAVRPERVSLVCMGNEGLSPAEEDELCAEYLRSLLCGAELPGIGSRLSALRNSSGKKFFDPALQQIFPKADFGLCIRRNVFPCALRIEKDRDGFVTRPVRG